MYRCRRLLDRGLMATVVTALVAGASVSQETVPAAGVELLSLTPPDLEHLEGAVAEQLGGTHRLLESLIDRPGVTRQELAWAFGDAGRLYHAYDLLEPAATCYGNAGRLVPGDFRWIYLAAVLDQQAGRIESATAGFERALEVEPGSLPALVRLGEAHLANHRPQDARAALDRALALEPSSPSALAALGQVALSQKRFGEAVERLEAARAAAPVADRLHHPLGLAYRGLGDMDKAREHLSQRGKVGVKPADPLIDELPQLKTGERVFRLRGQMAFRAGRFGEAAEAFTAALAAQPESVAARVDLGSALAAAGRRDDAISRFREALELAPDNRTAHFNLGVLLAQAGDVAGAEKALAAAVALDAADAEARLELARVLQRQGRWQEAGDYAARVVELDPASADARLLESQALVGQGRYAAARQRLEEAHSLMPEAGRVVAALAKLLAASPDLAQRDGARALDLARRVYEATRDVRHAEILAMALAETGSCDEAVDLQGRTVEVAREAGPEALARSLAGTLALLEKRPCRMPGS